MYTAKNFEHLLGLSGFSDQSLKNHFTLYQGYVKNFNLLNDALVALEREGKYGAPEYAELNRRFGWEFNGMRLHELYFENLTKSSSPAALTPTLSQGERERVVMGDGVLLKKINQEFGSYEFFEKDFRAMGAMRGIGWVILYYDQSADRLFNVWVNEHDVGHFAGATPLLVMDVFEHAFLTDYGLKRVDYIEAFFKAIDWKAVEGRL